VIGQAVIKDEQRQSEEEERCEQNLCYARCRADHAAKPEQCGKRSRCQKDQCQTCHPDFSCGCGRAYKPALPMNIVLKTQVSPCCDQSCPGCGYAGCRPVRRVLTRTVGVAGPKSGRVRNCPGCECSDHRSGGDVHPAGCNPARAGCPTYEAAPAPQRTEKPQARTKP